MTLFRPGREIRLWGQSTDLSQEGIGVTVIGHLTAEQVVALQISLPEAKMVTFTASVRYCKRRHCGFEFIDVQPSQREVIRAACQKLRTAITSETHQEKRG